MSHTLTCDVKFTDPDSIAAACREMGLPAPTERGSVALYQGQIPGAIGIQLPGWNYPVAITADGTAKFDNYNGSWGKTEHLDKFKQLYAVHRASKAARLKGQTVQRVMMANGSIKLVIQSR